MLRRLVFCLALMSCAGRFPPTAMTLAKSEYAATVRLLVACLNGPKIGSGVIISNRHVLTAQHVVSCELGSPLVISATDYNGKPYLLGVDKEHSVYDVSRLVALDGATPFKFWARLTSEKPEVGDPACTVGGDDKTFLLRKCGEVIPSSPGIVATNIHSVPGNSGSPVFNDVGYVTGILVRAQWDPTLEFVTVAIALQPIRAELLNDLYPAGL